MLKPLFLLHCLLFLFIASGQEVIECETPRKDSATFFAQPWVQDPNYLEDFRLMLDSVFSGNGNQTDLTGFKTCRVYQDQKD